MSNLYLPRGYPLMSTMNDHTMPSNMSSASENSTLSGYTRNLAFPRSHVHIKIDNHFSSKVYTTGSPISGTVSIKTRRDVRFDSVQIVLLGVARTRVDGVSSPAESSHIFLKLSMPISESIYPVPRILENGRTYTIPFNFVIPPHLTIGACNHHVESNLVQDHHVRLPPTMGYWEKDDLAPQMAKIEYSIKARVYREPELHGKLIKVVESSYPIQVLPASLEEPPLSLTKHDKEYAMTKSKSIRKNLISGKIGRVTALATQPEAVSLRPDGLGISSTNAQVRLNFEPASPEVPPPKVTAVSAKISAHTFYASGPISTFPNLGDWNRSFSAEKRGDYATSVPLFSQAIGKFNWVQKSNQSRRDSGYASDSPGNRTESAVDQTERRGSRGSKKSRKSGEIPIYHTAVLQFPIKLPLSKKTFIPTFHSCIISRTYAINLSITLGSGSTSNTINLSLPLQIAVDMDGLPEMGLPSFETAMEEAEADQFLRPRLLSVPDVHYQQTSELPGYGDWNAARQSIAAR